MGAHEADSITGVGAVRESLSEKAPWKRRPEEAEKAELRKRGSVRASCSTKLSRN